MRLSRLSRVIPLLAALLLCLPALSQAATYTDPYQNPDTVYAQSNTTATSTQRVCAGSQVPAGSLIVDFYYDSTANCFPINSWNVWVLEDLTNLPVGTLLKACTLVNSNLPAGWRANGYLLSGTQCGRPLYLTYYNVVELERISGSTTQPPTSSPDGFFDAASCSSINGWAWDAVKPTTPVTVDILSNGLLVTQVVANQFRSDLQAAGKGDGRHGFNIPVPKSLLDNAAHSISVKISGTSFTLPGSSRPIQCPNPIDSQSSFVRQHYLDFLNREPDQSGLNFWTNNITSCGTDAACIDFKRVETSKAFFLSIEFQQTGYFVHRFYKASYGRVPTILEFFADKPAVGNGVVVGATGWEQALENNKQAFANNWAQRASFKNVYDPLNNTQFVDTLFNNAQVTPDATFRNDLIAGLTNGTYTRATALRRIVESQAFADHEFNPAFALMQYFGYLRRNPSDAPDGNLNGYNFWLGQLNQYNDQNNMVRAFITSLEYRGRFGKP